MIDKQAVGRRIAILRKQLGYAQSAFAEKLGVSTQAVSKWETGAALPDIEVLLNISWMGKASLHAILEGEDFVDAQSSVDRGLIRIRKSLVCPQCREGLALRLAKKQENGCFECKNGHRYEVADGVLYCNTREIAGEQWSLTLRNYEHYLLEQHHAGNPRYWQGDPHFREVMWRHIQALRPRVIVDMACGTGSGIKYMIERIHWPVTIIMTDLSHRILKWNRVFFGNEWKNPYVDMVYLACDCANLPLADQSVDLVFSNGGFESMQAKMMNGFAEGYRILGQGGHAVYNISAVDDHGGGNTKKWIRLLKNLEGFSAGEDKMNDIGQWLAKCRQAGYEKNETVKIYGELPAPEDNVFPFENEILQWMAEYVVDSAK